MKIWQIEISDLVIDRGGYLLTSGQLKIMNCIVYGTRALFSKRILRQIIDVAQRNVNIVTSKISRKILLDLNGAQKSGPTPYIYVHLNPFDHLCTVEPHLRDLKFV